MKALVTGGAGFVPSHLVDELLRRGWEVVVLDDFSSGRLENLEAAAGRARVVRADVSDAKAVLDAAQGCDVVYHAASLASVPATVRDPARAFAADGAGALAALEAARAVDAKRFVLMSSAAVYGKPEYLPMDEAHPTRPRSPYAAAKLSAEHLARAWEDTYGLPATILRIFNTYGPRQRRYVLYDLYRKMTADPSHVEVLGTGDEVRDYVYVDDVARALAEAGTRAGMAGRTFNVGSGRALRVRELTRMLMDRLGLNGETTLRFTGASWPGDVPALHADVARLAEAGLAPLVPLDRGLDATVAWFRENVRQ